MYMANIKPISYISVAITWENLSKIYQPKLEQKNDVQKRNAICLIFSLN